jgi:hypothetical protein
MSSASISVSKDDLAKLDALLDGINNGAAVVLVRSINRAVSGVGTDSAKAIAQVLNLKQKDIKENFKTEKAFMAAIKGRFASTGKPVALIKYGARIGSGGVLVQVKKNRAKSKFVHAFMARAKSGHLLMLERSGEYAGKGKPIGQPKAGYYYTFPALWGRQFRYPVKEMYGPRVEDVMGDEIDGLSEKANERFTKTMDQQVKYLIEKGNPPSE